MIILNLKKNQIDIDRKLGQRGNRKFFTFFRLPNCTNDSTFKGCSMSTNFGYNVIIKFLLTGSDHIKDDDTDFAK